MRGLDQYPRPVPGIRFGTRSAAVGQVFENRQPLFDDVMGRDPFDIYNEACSTGFVFKTRIIQALLGR